jgi:zinc transporter 1
MSRSVKLIITLVLTFLFFLVELIIGKTSNSLALISDSFHMLSDVLALAIALLALRISKKKSESPKLSYGWQRAEILGSLVNCVFLLGLCFTIILDAFNRFFVPEEIKDPKLVLIVGCSGLAINVFCLIIFEIDFKKKGKKKTHLSEENELELANSRMETSPPIHSHHHHGGGAHRHDMNMRAMMLHLIGDALGSVAVIVSALIVWLTDLPHKNLADPLTSLIITIFIICSTVPIFKVGLLILLQATPNDVKIASIMDEIQNLDDVFDLHELHIWQLSESKFVGSVHIICKSQSQFINIASDIKKIMHKHGVHSTTIQPEYTNGVETMDDEVLQKCFIKCFDDSCKESKCCN